VIQVVEPEGALGVAGLVPDMAAGEHGHRRAPQPAAPPLSSPRLVGRTDELDLLLHALRRPPALVVIEGEAGVGKTRLLDDLVHSPKLVDRRLTGRSHQLREPFPFGPIVDALRASDPASLAGRLSHLAGALRPLLPELASGLPPMPETGGDSRLDRHILFRALLEVLAALGPTLLVLEDMHWADESTLEFLQFLTRQIPDQLGLVVTYRREDLPRGSRLLSLEAAVENDVSSTHVHLAPLTQEEVRDLIRAILSADEVSDEFTEYLHERTSGIPFAIEEVLRLAQDRHDLARRGGVWMRRNLAELGVPPVIRDAVVQRVEELSPGGQRVAEAAAVLGVAAPEEVLLGVAEASHEDLSETLAAAVVFEVEEDRYCLRHTLAMQAVVQGIPRPTRRRLHFRAAELLAGLTPIPAALLAQHYREARAIEQWAHYSEVAADAAVSVRDAAGAAVFLRDVIRTAGVAPADRARLAMKLARAALSSVTAPDSTSDLLNELVEDADLPLADRAELRALLGLLHVSAGDASAGYRAMAEAVPALGERPRAATIVMINLAAPWVVEGHASDHLLWLERAAVAAQDCPDPAAQLAVLLARALVPLYLGDPAGWKALEAIPWDAPAEPAQLMWASSNLVGACFHLGHYSRARAFLDDACRRAEALGWGPLLHVSESASILLDWASGSWAGLEARARRQAAALGDFPGWSVNGRLVEGSLVLARGDLDRAEQIFRDAFTAARSAGIIPGFEIAAARLARIALERGEPEAAVIEANRGIEVVQTKGVWVWAAGVAPTAVEALCRCRRREAAAELVSRFEEGLLGRDAPAAHAALVVCQGILADAGRRDLEAEELYGEAERALRALPRPYDAARVAISRGRCLLRAGQVDEGTAVVNEALAYLDELGASIDAARARCVLREFDIAIRKPWRGGRRGYGSTLSPREEEIARYVERGMSNVEIAKTLYLSARTVEHHLTAAMQKKGVRTRAQLAAAMRDGPN
jgi:ATP/maltotriose-dependent transcriptional regulator MalT